MKFQKGLLDDLKQPKIEEKIRSDAVDRRPAQGSFIADDRLFQTHRRAARSWTQYLKLLGAVAVLVAITTAIVFYLTLPTRGDQVRAPRGLENAIRNHFVDVEKRTTGDIAFFYCEDHYWARVEVEKRPDIKTDPIYQIGTYAARATGSTESGWQITASPITVPEDSTPCR